jgi:hypothetical protein
MPDKSRGDGAHLLLPLLIVSSVLIAIVPWLHPHNTCTDWLVKWGQQSGSRDWIRIHELATAAFATAAAAGIFLPLLGPRSRLSILGGAALSGGFILHARTILSHATQVSLLARVYTSEQNEASRNLLRTTAEAILSYDDASWKAGAALVSAGGCALVYCLYRSGSLSRWMAILMLALASLWAAQTFGVIKRVFGFGFRENEHWFLLAAWLTALGILLELAHRKRAAEDRGSP